MKLKLVEIKPKYTSDGVSHAYSVVDITKKTLPLHLGYMEYNDRTGTWVLERVRTQESIYRTMPKLLQPEDMKWIHSIFSKRYRNCIGYN